MRSDGALLGMTYVPAQQVWAWHYHDLADTIDKVPLQLIEDSSAIVIDLVRYLAADESLVAWRRPPADTEKIFTRFGLEKRLRAMGLWP